jgi:hypothetical protein
MTTKKLVIIKGKGTPAETRIETNVTLYWSERLGRWVTIPTE